MLTDRSLYARVFLAGSDLCLEPRRLPPNRIQLPVDFILNAVLYCVKALARTVFCTRPNDRNASKVAHLMKCSLIIED